MERYVTMVNAPRIKRHAIMPLSAEQARAFLAAAKGTRFEGLYVLALTTGMRIGELLGLRWHDVDLDAATLHVQHALVRTQGGLQLAEPKTPRARRRITLSPLAVEALRHHRRQQAQERLRLGRVWEDHALVFCNELGKPMEPGNLTRRLFLPLLTAAKLPKIRLHDLRHTAATLLLRQGVHPKMVSDLLGHSSVALTLDRYSHVLPDMQQQVATAMHALLTREK